MELGAGVMGSRREPKNLGATRYDQRGAFSDQEQSGQARATGASLEEWQEPEARAGVRAWTVVSPQGGSPREKGVPFASQAAGILRFSWALGGLGPRVQGWTAAATGPPGAPALPGHCHEASGHQPWRSRAEPNTACVCTCDVWVRVPRWGRWDSLTVSASSWGQARARRALRVPDGARGCQEGI